MALVKTKVISDKLIRSIEPITATCLGNGVVDIDGTKVNLTDTHIKDITYNEGELTIVTNEGETKLNVI